jgi:hypothetical protein
MSYSRLSKGEGDVTLYAKTITVGLSLNVCPEIAWRPKMQYMSTHSMMTMHYLPQINRKMLSYAVSWMLAIATSTFGIVAYA